MNDGFTRLQCSFQVIVIVLILSLFFKKPVKELKEDDDDISKNDPSMGNNRKNSKHLHRLR